MAGLFTALNAGKTSLFVNQKNIEIIGNNISNVNTEGYSHQSANMTPYPSMHFGNFFVGQGVIVDDVIRDHDVFVSSQLQEKSIEFGLQSGQTNSLAELERIFNVTEENISTDIDRFFDTWQELSANPSGLVERDIVIQQGELLATKFHNTVNDLNKVKENINDAVYSKVDDLNSKATEIAELNQRIFSIEIHGQTANGSRDRRDMLARELAESIGVSTYEDTKGMLAVQLPGGLPLVQGTEAMSIEAVTVGPDLELRLHAGGVTRVMGLHNLGGEFKGLVQVRDVTIPNIKNDLDRLAYQLSVDVNVAHAAGAGLDSVSGRNFFFDHTAAPPPPPADPWLDASRNIEVILTDSNHVAAAQAPPAPGPPANTVQPGDNRNALILSNMGDAPSMGVDNYNAFYGKMTATIGLESRQNLLALGGAEDAVVQLQNVRDGLAGVSLEEEMISLIQFQRGFESSAKFLSTVDEMMGSLIDLKR